MDRVTRPGRIDAIAFGIAFGTGVLLYFLLRLVFGHQQWVLMVALVLVMTAYVGATLRLKALRVRLDQAADNAYYLGLLFTLTSMAFALHDFRATTGSGGAGSTGVGQIISNFGIALATTITGIFFRVLLSQVRVDPGDFEKVTRVELADAAGRVRGDLDNISIDLGEFHRVLRQRADDVTAEVMKHALNTVGTATDQVEKTTSEMIKAVGETHRSILTQTKDLSSLVASTATAAIEAIEKLKGIEAPPLTLSRRLVKLAELMETAATKIDGTVVAFESSAATAGKAAENIAKVARSLDPGVTDSFEKVGKALEHTAEKLEEERTLLDVLQQQIKVYVEDSKRAQTASVEVLVKLAEVAREVTAALSKSGQAHG